MGTSLVALTLKIGATSSGMGVVASMVVDVVVVGLASTTTWMNFKCTPLNLMEVTLLDIVCIQAGFSPVDGLPHLEACPDYERL